MLSAYVDRGVHGETPYAFSLKKPFPAPEAINELPAQVVMASSPDAPP